MRWIVGSLMLLALAFGSGCSDSDQAAGEASGGDATIQARSLPAIWADILTQRDRVHASVSKGTEMWHEDCAEVGSAATALDTLVLELGQRVAEEPSVEDRRKRIAPVIGYLQTTHGALRTAAIDEIVGDMPGLMIGLDSVLQGLEKYFTREEIGSESVVTRPGFNSVRPPPPESPI